MKDEQLSPFADKEIIVRGDNDHEHLDHVLKGMIVAMLARRGGKMEITKIISKIQKRLGERAANAAVSLIYEMQYDDKLRINVWGDKKKSPLAISVDMINDQNEQDALARARMNRG